MTLLVLSLTSDLTLRLFINSRALMQEFPRTVFNCR